MKMETSLVLDYLTAVLKQTYEQQCSTADVPCKRSSRLRTPFSYFNSARSLGKRTDCGRGRNHDLLVGSHQVSHNATISEQEKAQHRAFLDKPPSHEQRNKRRDKKTKQE